MSFTDPLKLATEAIETYRNQVDQNPVMPPQDLTPLRQKLQTFTFEYPIEAKDLIEEVANTLTNYAVHTTNKNYFGLFNPDVVPISVAADAIVAGFNPQLAAYSHNPAANEIERHTLAFFLKLAGLEGGTGAFTSGGSEANQSAVIVALTHQFKDFSDKGKQGQPTLYVSAEAHHSFVKIAHACGIGREAVREVEVNEDLRMSLPALAQQIARDKEQGKTPFMVVGTAGTTSAGAIDPLPFIAKYCRQNNLWFHVDAAWGGAALLSPALSLHLAGIELADSITIDAHKWLSVPMGAGMFLCAHPKAVQTAFGIQTSYMPAPLDTPDPYLSSIQWSRRFTGLKVFMALANLGQDGYRDQIEHQSAMSHLLATRLKEEGCQITTNSPFATTTFKPPTGTAKECVQRIHQQRRAWVSEAKLSHHGSVVRACVTNYRTSEEEIEALVKEVVPSSLKASPQERSGMD
ncbi:MAG: aspartate aminotransferase family protein [Fimbriimonas sp.]